MIPSWHALVDCGNGGMLEKLDDLEVMCVHTIDNESFGDVEYKWIKLDVRI